MTIGTKLFTQWNVNAFSRSSADIADLQARISAGKNDPRASIDPIRAMRLSVANEQVDMLDRFERNVDAITSRLDITDQTLGQLSELTQRLREITVMGVSDTMGPKEREALRIEVNELRNSIFDLANTTDGMGRSLFGGFRNATPPFRQEGNQISYVGDRGQHELRVSETASLGSGADGITVFMSIETDYGTTDVFSMLDDLSFALEERSENFKSTAEVGNSASLKLDAARIAEPWSMTLTGPSGSAQISAEISYGAVSPMVDAINAQTAQTGITATVSADGLEILLSSPEGTAMSISDIAPQTARRAEIAQVQNLDQTGLPVGAAQQMISTRYDTQAQLQQMSDLNNHVTDRRAEIGSLGAAAKWHTTSIIERRTLLEETISGLEDLDVAKAITDLQQLMLTRDASQQTFAKISQKSLFDFIR